MVANCKQEHWKSDIFSEYFAEKFQLFAREHFKLANPDDRCKLRDLLRNRRESIQKCQYITISGALCAFVKERNPWPKEKIDDGSLTEHKAAHFTAETQVDDPAQLKLDDETITSLIAF